MGVITGNINTRGGSGTITLDDGALPTTNMELSSIGTMSIEFDIEDQADTAKSIFFGESKLKFKAFDRLDNGDSLFNQLDSVPATDPILVDLSYTTDDGKDMPAELQMFTKDVSYNRERREVTMEATVNATTSATIDAIFNNDSGDVQQYATSQSQSDSGITNDCMSLNDFVLNTLPLLGRDGALSTFYDVNNLSSHFNSDYNSTDGEEGWIVIDSDNTDQLAIDLIYRICAIEGCIFAAIFDQAFVVNRLSTSNDVTISEDDAESLDIKLGYDEYFSIKIIGYGESSTNSFVTKGLLKGDSDALNSNATKALSIYFDFTDYDLAASEWDATNGNYIEQAVTTDSSNRGTGIFVDGDADEELGRFFIDDGSGGSASSTFSQGDMFYVNKNNSRPSSVPYIVDNQTSDVMVLQTALENQLNDNNELNILSDGNRDEVAVQGADSYKKAYSADGSRNVSITLFDLDLLQPYETFSCDNSFPVFLQGQTFRPSKLTYDLQADKINVEAYQIG